MLCIILVFGVFSKPEIQTFFTTYSIKYNAIGYAINLSIEFNAYHFKYDTLSHFHVQHILDSIRIVYSLLPYGWGESTSRHVKIYEPCQHKDFMRNTARYIKDAFICKIGM